MSKLRYVLWPAVAFVVAAIAWWRSSDVSVPQSPRTPGSSAETSDPAHSPSGQPSELRATTSPAGSRLPVTDGSGAPVRGARYRIAISTDFFRTFEVKETDDFDWPANAWAIVQVWAPGMAPRAVMLTEGPAPISLSPGVNAQGVAVDAGGTPIAHAKLRLEPIFLETNLTNKILTQMKLSDGEVTTDSRGGFSVDSLRPGDYRVVFTERPGAPSMILRVSELRTGKVTVRAPWK